MSSSRRKHTSFLLITLLTVSTLSFWVGTLPIKAQATGSGATSTSSDYGFVDLEHLALRFAELRDTPITTIGTVKFSPSLYQFEDFWLKGPGSTAVPVVVRLAGLPLPQDGSLVKLSGTVESSSLEGGFFYLNASLMTTEKNVILLGWDGAQRNHLFELLGRGLMPNLDSFVRGGKMVNVTVPDHYTDTKAGWTQILTGYRWWRTGVFSNNCWFHSIPAGYTIPERLENIFGKDQLSTAFITGKLNQMEIVDGTGTAAPGSAFAIYSHEALYRNLPSQLDVISVGDLEQDRYADVVGPLCLQFIENNTNNHFFAFFHFSNPDHLGHLYGENSVQYEQGIEACDYWLGKILTKLNTLGIAENTLIYITADHGFDEGSHWHSNAPYIFLTTNDKNVIRDGDEVDVAPTIYYGLGLWNYSFSPALDGFPLQVNLPMPEAQHRQDVLADNARIQFPTASIADSGAYQKVVTFNASDNNLAAVLITVDDTLKTDGPWTWNKTSGTITAYGFYSINTADLSLGPHNVKILAFDEHGANNGDPEKDPASGGGPAVSRIDFVVSPTQPVVPEFPTAVMFLVLIAFTSCSLFVLKRKTKSIQPSLMA